MIEGIIKGTRKKKSKNSSSDMYKEYIKAKRKKPKPAPKKTKKSSSDMYKEYMKAKKQRKSSY